MSNSRKEMAGDFAPLVLRLALGFYFILLGLWGYLDPGLSSQTVQNYAAFAADSAEFYVYFASCLFSVAGVLLTVGWFTRLAALTGVAVMLPLLYGAGLFASGSETLGYFIERRSLFKDAVIFAACLSLIISGAGIISFDRFFKTLYGRTS